MAGEQTVVWRGASGKNYTYYIPAAGSNYLDVDGNYIFCKIQNNMWVPVYIGQGNLKDRIGPNHHKWTCFTSKGATHVHTHINPDERSRLAEESDLLSLHTIAYAPTGCNEKEGG